MALIKALRGKKPQIPNDAYLAETATIIGDVEMGSQCSIWFNAVIRGDVHEIRLGDRVNIQDNAMIHATYQKCGTYIGNDVSIGHNAIVHGCKIHDKVLIGMGAIVMDNCVVHSNSIVAAGAVLREGTVVEEGSVYAGIPAKKVKDINPALFEGEVMRIAQNYIKYASWYQEEQE